MMQRMKGTLRPGRKAGVLALAVLLLTCVLMAGAVSASGEVTEFNESSFKGDTYTISKEGTYVLNNSATGNIKIEIKADADGDVILKAINGATLTGGIQITAAKSVPVTVKDMHIKSTLISGSGSDARNLAITLSGASIQLCLENNTIEFAASDDVAKKRSSVISTTIPLSDGSEISNNTISGVTAHVLNTAGVVDGGMLTVRGNTVTMNPNEPIGSNEEKQGTGRALLKLFHPDALNSKVTYIVTDNVVKLLSDESYDATVVRVDKETDTPKMITVTMYNNTYNGSSASPYLYGGSIYGYELGGLNITVSKTDETRILVPGLNQTGVVWSGGADAENQELELSKSGSYKLMDGFVTTGSGVKITADGVTLDGNDKKITTDGKLQGYILKVAVDGDDTENAEGVTLQKLDITGGVASGTGNYGGVTVYAGEKKASVPVTLRDSTIDMSRVTATDSMNPAVYFVSASDSEIANNVIKAGNTEGTGDGVTSRGIVIDGGSEITVSKNDVTMGTGAESIGVQIKGSSPNDVAVTGNTITAPDDPNTKSIAVDITTTGKGESHSITGNTISAADSVKFDSAVRVLLSKYISDDGGSLDITVSGNTVTGAAKGVYIMAGSPEAQEKQLKLTGTINEDDFQGLSRDAILASDSLLTNLNTDVKWTRNPEPSYSSGGNMNNAYRVLFNDDGATTLSVQTDLSSGDKLTEPATPVKDGYTFAGWYKDSACTQGWDFETGISGDMTLYAKWTAAGSSGETEATATPTATATAVTTPQPTKTQTAAATTSAPQEDADRSCNHVRSAGNHRSRCLTDPHPGTRTGRRSTLRPPCRRCTSEKTLPVKEPLFRGRETSLPLFPSPPPQETSGWRVRSPVTLHPVYQK